MNGKIDFYVVDLPIQPVAPRVKYHNDGNRNFKNTETDSVLYRNGCLRHDCRDCENCPMPDCDWDYEMERKLRAKLKKGQAQCQNA